MPRKSIALGHFMPEIAESLVLTAGSIEVLHAQIIMRHVQGLGSW